MMKMTLNEEIEYLKSGNWYDKVQAVLPTDEYLKLGWAIGDILETLELLRSLAPEPQTNADCIRAMSDEELAERIWPKFGCPNGKNHVTCGYVGECKDCWMEWFQQPAEEDT